MTPHLIHLTLSLSDGTRRTIQASAKGTMAALDAAGQLWPDMRGGSAKVVRALRIPGVEIPAGPLARRLAANEDTFAQARA